MGVRERLKQMRGRVALWVRGAAESLDDKAKLLRIEGCERRLAARGGDLLLRFTGAAAAAPLAMGRAYELRVDARALLPVLFARVRERIARKAFSAGTWSCAGGITALAEACVAARGPELAVAEADCPDFPMGLPAECVRSFVCPVCGEHPGEALSSRASDAPAEVGGGMGWALHCPSGHLLVRSGRMGA